jgi:phosphomannomutase
MELFGTAGIRGAARTEVTPSFVLQLGRSAAEAGAEFVVGRDGRETSQALASALEAGLSSGGADVVRLGQVPTPVLAYASRDRRGIMVTASHNPPSDNGLKFFADGVEYDRTAEGRIESRFEADRAPLEWDRWGIRSRSDVIEPYRNSAVEYVREVIDGCDGVRVAVDCGNGTSSLTTPELLRELGATVTTLNASIDGHFPGRSSKPTPDTLADLRAFVAEGAFDLGIGHDGDGDRIVVVDADGDVVHEDTILAIVANRYTEMSDAADPVVVTTPNASGRIDERVEAAGGRVERVRLGALHEGVSDVETAGGDDTETVFAAEPWKHVHPGFGPWIDATISAGVVVALVAEKGLPDLRAPIEERPYRKASIECPDGKKQSAMSCLETRLPEAFPEAEAETEYGVRLTFPNGAWALVRPSGTEPYIRIYAESEAVGELIGDVTGIVERAIEAT